MPADPLTTTVSTKGQVILPKALREELHWPAGTRLVVENTERGVLLRPLQEAFAATRPEDVFGSLPPTGGPKSIDEMQAGLDAEIRKRHARGRY